MKEEYLQRIHDSGFNTIPITSDKRPKGKWAMYQTEKVTKIEKSTNYALICGYNDVECIDVDLKVLPAKKDRDSFYDELIEMINNHIEDYKDKLVIKKTLNNGYHIIYRADNIGGNKKLATLKGSTEAIIETRGIGGYIMIYEDVITLDYHNIKKITNEERDVIIYICRSFNEILEDDLKVDHKTEKVYKGDDGRNITPWDDYNNQNSVWNVISDEFVVVKEFSNKIMIRRNGAKSPHSGYIFKDSDKMYIFSTGSSYESEKSYTAFGAYTHKYHFGDAKRAASQLYSEGYGDRRRPQLQQKEKARVKEILKRPKPKKNIVFPIEIFPSEIQVYLRESERTLSNSIDYMGCALLWTSSLIIGNSIKLSVKKGWNEISTVWIALVGEAGIGKTPSLSSVLFPLKEINAKEIRKFQDEKKVYDEYMALDAKEKKDTTKVNEPKKSQFIVDDVTIEALIRLHASNPNGIGVLKDELAGWFKDMNKYNEGSDKERWLSSWSGDGISVDRITRASDYIHNPIMPVLGGIQPTILSSFYTEENKESGFLDRMLFSFPDLSINQYNEDEISDDLLGYFHDWLLMVYQEMRKIVSFNTEGDIVPIISGWTSEARKEWIRVFNKLTTMQNSDSVNEFMKPMLAKQKTYMARFCLLINTLNACHKGTDLTQITKKSVLSAEKLVDYFISMNEKMIIINTENATARKTMAETKGNSIQKLKAIMEDNPEYNKTQLAKQLGVSRNTLYQYLKELQK